MLFRYLKRDFKNVSKQLHLVAAFNLLSTTNMFDFISRLPNRDAVLLSPYPCERGAFVNKKST